MQQVSCTGDCHVYYLMARVQVSQQLSHLAVVDGQQQASRRAPVGSHRQPPSIVFARRQSAPGPVGQAVEPGSRKPWSYTPSFGVGCGPGRVTPVSSRPV